MTSEKIKAVHRENYSAYGAKKVYAALNRAGQRVAWCTVERLMRRARLHGVRRERFASVGAKGDWVVSGRAALKVYLQRLNEPKQPDDAQFEALLAAPFTPPPKKKTNDRRF